MRTSSSHRDDDRMREADQRESHRSSYLTGSEQVVSGFAKAGYPPIALLGLLAVSYFTRPAARRVSTLAISGA
jgi:hypothetical protein